MERLGKQPCGSAEASVIRNYLDVCLELPWHKFTRERADVAQARKILDKDHYGIPASCTAFSFLPYRTFHNKPPEALLQELPRGERL